MNSATWAQWREDILEVIRGQCRLFPHIQHDDIDWDAWQPLYEEGYTAHTAVTVAFSGGLFDQEDEAHAA